jgi:hypothetical protein
LDGLPCMPCLPWPQRAFPLLLAAPLLPIALLPVILLAGNLVYVNYALYIGPMLVSHVLAALLQTASLLVTSSLLTASIRDIFTLLYCHLKGLCHEKDLGFLTKCTIGSNIEIFEE